LYQDEIADAQRGRGGHVERYVEGGERIAQDDPSVGEGKVEDARTNDRVGGGITDGDAPGGDLRQRVTGFDGSPPGENTDGKAADLSGHPRARNCQRPHHSNEPR